MLILIFDFLHQAIHFEVILVVNTLVASRRAVYQRKFKYRISFIGDNLIILAKFTIFLAKFSFYQRTGNYQ